MICRPHGWDNPVVVAVVPGAPSSLALDTATVSAPAKMLEATDQRVTELVAIEPQVTASGNGDSATVLVALKRVVTVEDASQNYDFSAPYCDYYSNPFDWGCMPLLGCTLRPR